MSPHPKVAAAGGASALSIILVWIAGQAGLTVPSEVASAFTALLSLAAGYLKS